MIKVVPFPKLRFSDSLCVCVLGKNLESYPDGLSGTFVALDIVPMPNRILRMGRPASENGGNPSQRRTGTVEVDGPREGEFEVTWRGYNVFVYTAPLAGGTTSPTRPFVDMSFGTCLHSARGRRWQFPGSELLFAIRQSQPKWKQRDPPIPNG